MVQKAGRIITTIAPWLSVDNGTKAVDYYKKAFNALETYRLEDPTGGIVVKLSVDGAEFWISGGTSENKISDPGSEIRMVLTSENPDELFENALKAGAIEIFPISEEYGWRLGRLMDPFGFHWEIGHPLA